ncbi:MAG: regulatory protein RecX [Bdellovibrionales bacterium]
MPPQMGTGSLTNMYYQSAKEKSDDVLKCTDKIVDYLARRDHSVKELKTKLSRRFTRSAIDQALEIAEERSWLKTPEELSARVAETLHLRGKGFRYIQNYLREKGLPPIDRDDDREKQKAESALIAKYGDFEALSYDEKQKAYRFLASRGYDLEIIKSVF